MIYLDNASTTPLCAGAKDAMINAFELYANPSSTHFAGIEAARLIDASRKKIASALGCKDRELIFTSCGSEGNNQAIGAALSMRAHAPKRIITSDSEHPSVYETLKAIEGFEIIYIPTRGGSLDMEMLRDELQKGCALVSIMHVNNETGAIYDIPAVKRAIDASGCRAILHCDDVQGFLKTPPVTPYCDLVTVSAHKIGGPKGIGALVSKLSRTKPLIYGGGQEQNRRSGTENTINIAGFAAACDEWMKDPGREERVAALRDRLENTLVSACGDKIKVLCPEKRAASILSVSLDVTMGGRRAGSEVMLNKLSAMKIAVSAGSACHASHRDNRVLTAYGLDRTDSGSTLRISLGHQNTSEEVDAAADAIIAMVCPEKR